MCILRRVSEEFDRLHDPRNDRVDVLGNILAGLSAPERDEFRRQYSIVEGMQPQCGSFEKALDAFEAMNPGLA